MRVRVKICGITNISDALLAVDLGADALGFVFHRPSPRYVEPSRAREIARMLPPFVRRVGVFAGVNAASAAAMGQAADMDLLQIHARAEGEVPEAWRDRVIPVFSVSETPTAWETEENAKLLDTIRASGASYFLLDAAGPGGAGGTGRKVSWELARDAARVGKMVLAGGLTPINVSTAIATVAPYAVDVASGIERSPGIKDPMMMEAFFDAVNRAGMAVR